MPRVGSTLVKDAPIGIFDSGVGGLTVARAILQLLPRESLLYIGDTARSPYGPKPIADVRRYSLEILDTLVEQGVKMLEMNPNVTVFAQACPRFVDFVEAGVTGSPEVLRVAEDYLAPLRHAGVDT